MYVSGIIWESVVDGDGIRTTIFISGCEHNCIGCQNPLTHNFQYGVEFTKDKQMEVVNKVKNNPLIDGITLSGGDAMFSPKDTVDFVKLFKEYCPQMNIWIYTGFTFEQIILDPPRLELLKLCDVLVDGKFIGSQRDLSGAFKGSVNQRILDVKQSIKQNKAVTYEF